MPAQIARRIVPASRRLSAFRAEPGIRPEIAEHPVRPGKDVGIAAAVSSIKEHAIPLLTEQPLAKRHLTQSERLSKAFGCADRLKCECALGWVSHLFSNQRTRRGNSGSLQEFTPVDMVRVGPFARHCEVLHGERGAFP